MFQLWPVIFSIPLKEKDHAVPHWKALSKSKYEGRGLSTLKICQDILKSANLLYRWVTVSFSSASTVPRYDGIVHLYLAPYIDYKGKKGFVTKISTYFHYNRLRETLKLYVYLISIGSGQEKDKCVRAKNFMVCLDSGPRRVICSASREMTSSADSPYTCLVQVELKFGLI